MQGLAVCGKAEAGRRPAGRQSARAGRSLPASKEICRGRNPSIDDISRSIGAEPAVPEVLDGFSALLALSYFRDSQFTQARTKFQDAVDHAPMAEGLYQAMSSILFKAQLTTEAEALMDRATRVFPTSRERPLPPGRTVSASWKPKKALEVFENLSRMKPEGADPAVDRLQQSVVYQKIGSIHAEMAEFDKAATAYKKALEFTPDSVEARLGLGNVYLQQGRAKDALDEYNRAVAADSQSAAAHFGVADANLRMGLFAEASAAAAKVWRSTPDIEKRTTFWRLPSREWVRTKRARENSKSIGNSRRKRDRKRIAAVTWLLLIGTLQQNCWRGTPKKQSKCF